MTRISYHTKSIHATGLFWDPSFRCGRHAGADSRFITSAWGKIGFVSHVCPPPAAAFGAPAQRRFQSVRGQLALFVPPVLAVSLAAEPRQIGFVSHACPSGGRTGGPGRQCLRVLGTGKWALFCRSPAGRRLLCSRGQIGFVSHDRALRGARLARSRVGEGVTPLAPHGPGRADFPHPVLQRADSLQKAAAEDGFLDPLGRRVVAIRAGQRSYPSPFRGHGLRLQSTWRVSFRRLYHLVSPSLPWVPLGGVSQVHGYYATLRLPRTRTQRLMDSPLGSSPSPRLRSVRYEDASCRLAPLFPVRRRGTAGLGWEYGDLTGSWDAPSVPLPCSLTPAGPLHPTVSVLRCCPRTQYDEGSRGLTISGLNHTALARAVYASQPTLLPDHARLACGWW